VARQVSTTSPFEVPRRRLVVAFPKGTLSQPFNTVEELRMYLRSLAPLVCDASWHVEQP
jgi:hypothetical protein